MDPARNESRRAFAPDFTVPPRRSGRMRCIGAAVLVAALAPASGCSRPESETANGGPPPAGAPLEPAAGQGGEVEPAVAPDGWARLKFDRELHDFGQILDVEVHETSFLITNEGDEPLVIDRISASPGCVVLTDLAGTEHAPGDSVELRVRFEPMAYGPHQKFVDIHSNSEPTGFNRLTFAADVRHLVAPDRRYLNLGMLEFGAEHVETVTITCDRGPFTVDSLTTTNPNVTARLLPAGADDQPMQQRTLEVMIGAGSPWGSFGSWVELESTVVVPGREKPLDHRLRIPVQGAMLGALVPSPLTFRVTSNTGDVWRSRVVLRHREGRPFTVVDVSVAGTQLGDPQVAWEELADGGWAITLSGEAPGEPMTVQGAAIVITDVEEEGELALPIYMQVRGAATG